MAEKTVRIYGAIKPPKKMTKKEFETLKKSGGKKSDTKEKVRQ